MPYIKILANGWGNFPRKAGKVAVDWKSWMKKKKEGISQFPAVWVQSLLPGHLLVSSAAHAACHISMHDVRIFIKRRVRCDSQCREIRTTSLKRITSWDDFEDEKNPLAGWWERKNWSKLIKVWDGGGKKGAFRSKSRNQAFRAAACIAWCVCLSPRRVLAGNGREDCVRVWRQAQDEDEGATELLLWSGA